MEHENTFSDKVNQDEVTDWLRVVNQGERTMKLKFFIILLGLFLIWAAVILPARISQNPVQEQQAKVCNDRWRTHPEDPWLNGDQCYDWRQRKAAEKQEDK